MGINRSQGGHMNAQDLSEPWAGRVRWSLADKLPQLFKVVEDRAQAARETHNEAAARVGP